MRKAQILKQLSTFQWQIIISADHSRVRTFPHSVNSITHHLSPAHLTINQWITELARYNFVEFSNCTESLAFYTRTIANSRKQTGNSFTNRGDSAVNWITAIGRWNKSPKGGHLVLGKLISVESIWFDFRLLIYFLLSSTFLNKSTVWMILLIMHVWKFVDPDGNRMQLRSLYYLCSIS